MPLLMSSGRQLSKRHETLKDSAMAKFKAGIISVDDVFARMEKAYQRLKAVRSDTSQVSLPQEFMPRPFILPV
jgi:hypothetical protein